MNNSAARAVRGAIKLYAATTDVGQIVTGWTSLEVTNNKFASADSFAATFSIAALSVETNLAWFSSQKDMFAEVFIGTPANPNSWDITDLPPAWIFARVDSIEPDLGAGTIQISGRDLTALMIDAKTTQKWQNKTASQIAVEIGKSHGLDTSGVVATTTPVGKYYQIDHVTMTDSHTEWDLLTRLANIEKYTVHVRGQTLFFQPMTSDSATPYPVTWQWPEPGQGYSSSSAKGLKVERELTVSRGLAVTVRTWNDLACKVYHATYPNNSAAKSADPGQSGPKAQVYYYTIHNATQEEVTRQAQARYMELIQHEMKMSVDLPGDDVLDLDMTVPLDGTLTGWDQTYYPDSIKRSIDFHSGYRMELHAKNSAPDTSTSHS